MKKIALMAMLSTGAGLFAATGTEGIPAQPGPIANDRAYQAVIDQSVDSAIDQSLQQVQANPRQHLARRSSVATLNSFNVYDPGSATATAREVGVVRKAGDATAVLRNMLKDGMADFEKLIKLYIDNDIRKDLPLIPSFTQDNHGNFVNASPVSTNYSAVPNNLAMPINNLAEKIAKIGEKFDNYKITLPGFEAEGAVHNFAGLNGPAFEELVKEIVNCNTALRFDLASNGIDPR